MAEWSVLIFGDSWADYMTPTWPQVLGRRLQAQVFQFAQAGSMCADLGAQAQRAAMAPGLPRGANGQLRRETLVVVHTCGNDFISKIAQVFMGGLGGGLQNCEFLQPNPGAREVGVLRQFLDTMYRLGARHFLVSGVPIFLHMPIFNIAWPIVGNLVNAGQLESLGVSPGDPPQLAIEVQGAALHERWTELVSDFSKEHPDSKCLFFDEVEALHTLRSSLGAGAFDGQMWDFSMFHPSPFGHEQLASEAHKCTVEGIEALARRAPHPQAKVPAQKPATPAAGAPAVSATPSSAPVPAATASDSKASAASLQLQLRNVKGDVSFNVSISADASVAQLRAAALESAPSGFAPPGSTCVLAFAGKPLEDGKTLAEAGLKTNSQLFVVVRASGASPSNGAKP